MLASESRCWCRASVEEMRAEPTKAAAVARGEILDRLWAARWRKSASVRRRADAAGSAGASSSFLVKDIAHSGVGVLVVGLGIQHAGVGGTDGERLAGLDGVEEDEVSQDMASRARAEKHGRCSPCV